MEHPNSLSSAPSSVYSANKGFQKATLPSFDKLTFSQDTTPGGFRTWAQKLAALVEGNFQEGRLLHNFIDSKVGRSKLQTASQYSTVPAILMGEGFSQEAPSLRPNMDGSMPPRASPSSFNASSMTNPDDPDPEGDGEVHLRPRVPISDPQHIYEENYDQVYENAYLFPPAVQRLNKLLYVTLQSIYKGSGGALLNLPPHLATYTSAMIYLWDADKQNIAGRKIDAVNALRQQQYQGDATKWKLAVLNDIREIIETGYNINDMIYQCLFDMMKNQDGECLSILTKQLNELNSGPDPSGFQNWEKNLSPIIQHLLTNKAVTGGSAPVQAISDAPKGNGSRTTPTGPPPGYPPWATTPADPTCGGIVCGNCKQPAHHRRKDCPATHLDKGPKCGYCGVKGHKEEICNKKRADQQKEKAAPANSVSDAARRADLMSQLAALESKPEATKYVVADPEPPSSERVAYTPTIDITSELQGPLHALPGTGAEIYGQVLVQEGLTDSEGKKLNVDYGSQDYLSHLDSLMSDICAEQSLTKSHQVTLTSTDAPARATGDAEAGAVDQGKSPFHRSDSTPESEAPLNQMDGKTGCTKVLNDWEASECGQPADQERNQGFEGFLKSRLSPSSTTASTPPPVEGVDLSLAKMPSVATLGPPATPVVIQEGSAKTNLEPPRSCFHDFERTTVGEGPKFPILNVNSAEPDKGAHKVFISLCDGIGGGATALTAAGVHDVTRYIGVEIDATARKIAQHANPKTDIFPGIDHGWHQDIKNITEADIAALPANSVAGFIAGTPCGDFSKNRLLPSTAAYVEGRLKQARDDGGKYIVTKFPRRGLNGKHGGLFRTAIQIWRWVKKHHPNATYFFENVVFNDMNDDWAEVNAALGEPLVINSLDYSTTARNRAYCTMDQS